MRSYSVYEAKSRLSEALREVEKGGEVTITRHGRPIARLVPVAELPRKETFDQRIRRFEREGRITPAEVSPKEAFRRWPAELRLPKGALARFLAERD